MSEPRSRATRTFSSVWLLLLAGAVAVAAGIASLSRAPAESPGMRPRASGTESRTAASSEPGRARYAGSA